MASFAEKYVWIAVNLLAGYLADRLPVHLLSVRRMEPPVDLGVLCDVANPASDILKPLDSEPFVSFDSLAPAIALTGATQGERSNEWVERAPRQPDVRGFLLPPEEAVPPWARTHEWLLLRAFAMVKDGDSQAETAIWVSSAIFPASAVEHVKLDASARLLPDLHKLVATCHGTGSYRDPNEAIWAPWIREVEGTVEYCTVGDSGEPLAIDFQATSAEVLWDGPEGETHQWMPAQWLRRNLALTDFRAGQFLGKGGEALAFFHRTGGPSRKAPFSEVLLARRDVVEAVLRVEHRAMCWGIRMWREPAAPFRQRGQVRTNTDWSGVSILERTELTTHAIFESSEQWPSK